MLTRDPRGPPQTRDENLLPNKAKPKSSKILKCKYTNPRNEATAEVQERQEDILRSNFANEDEAPLAVKKLSKWEQS